MSGTSVTLTIPNGAPPGTLLSVPVRNGQEKIKVRVPDGMGAGSTVFIEQIDSSWGDEWDVRVGTVVPVALEDRSNGSTAIAAAEELYLREQATLEQAWREQQQLQSGSEQALGAPAPPIVQEASSLSNAIEYVSCNGMQLPIVAEHHLRTLHVTELREHAEFLYRTFGHERLGMPPPDKYEEVLSWVVQVQSIHIEPLRVDPGPPLEGAIAYTVRLDTTVGVIDIIVRPDWAPAGTQRFLELAAAGDLNDLAFYRAVKGCIVQFGLPAKRQWPAIPDDPPTGVPFLLGAVSFAAVGQNSRKSTLFICIGDMSHCLGQNSWETPIGAVAENSLDVLDNIETAYGDIAEFSGEGPDTTRINNEGNGYLRRSFPRLSYIRQAQTLDWFPETPLQLEPLTPMGAVSSSYNAPQQLEAKSPRGAMSPRQEELLRQHPSDQVSARARIEEALQQNPTDQVSARTRIDEALQQSPTDQVTMAALAAREAQAQAQLAKQLAQQVATTNQASFASQAAQAAQAAAEAAEAAMRAAQAVQAQQELELFERREALEREARAEATNNKTPSRQPEPEVSATMLTQVTEGARVRAVSPQRGISGPTRSQRKTVSTTPGGISNLARPESVDVPVEIVRPRGAPVQRINSYNPVALTPQTVAGSSSHAVSTLSYAPAENSLAVTPTRAPKTPQVQPYSVTPPQGSAMGRTPPQPTVTPWARPSQSPLLPQSISQQALPLSSACLPLAANGVAVYHTQQAQQLTYQQPPPVVGVNLTR